MRSHPGRTTSIYDIPAIVKTVMPQAVTQTNIQAGFLKTGIYPYNRNLFGEVDFAPSSVTDRPSPDTEETTSVAPSSAMHMLILDDNAVNVDEMPPISSEEIDPSPFLQRAGSIPNARKNYSRSDNIIPLPSTSLSGNSSIQNSTVNVQEPSASTSATASVFSPEIVRPFPKAPQRKIRGSRSKKSTIYTNTPEKEAVRQQYDAKQQRLEAKRVKKNLTEPNKGKGKAKKRRRHHCHQMKKSIFVWFA